MCQNPSQHKIGTSCEEHVTFLFQQLCNPEDQHTMARLCISPSPTSTTKVTPSCSIHVNPKKRQLWQTTTTPKMMSATTTTTATTITNHDESSTQRAVIPYSSVVAGVSYYVPSSPGSLLSIRAMKRPCLDTSWQPGAGNRYRNNNFCSIINHERKHVSSPTSNHQREDDYDESFMDDFFGDDIDDDDNDDRTQEDVLEDKQDCTPTQGDHKDNNNNDLSTKNTTTKTAETLGPSWISP